MWTITALALVLLAHRSAQQQGSQIDFCTWQNEDGSILNMTSVGNQDGTPKWKNLESQASELDPKYSLNPCFGFTQDGGCQNVTACRISNDDPETFTNIGDASTSNMYYSAEEGRVVLEYQSIVETITYVSRYLLACPPDGSTEDQVVVNGYFNSPSPNKMIYRFTILSPCACPDGCNVFETIAPPSVTQQPIATQPPTVAPITNVPPRTVELPTTKHTLHPIVTPSTKHTLIPINPTGNPGGKKPLTAGGIICIVFVVTLSSYFIFGALYMFLVRGARGVEAIPNVGFWQDLPLLILDGFSFLCSGCKANSSQSLLASEKQTEYDKI